MALLDAAKTNSPEELLTAMRDYLAGILDAGVTPRDAAPLTRRLIEVTEKLDKLKSGEIEDDEFGDMIDAITS